MFILNAQAPLTCSTLSKAQQDDLVRYVRAKYKLSENILLGLKEDAPVTGTCFRRLTFAGDSALKKWDLTLYLSPDGRYLTTDLYDTTLDPLEEERKSMAALMGELSQNKGASVGPSNAPVTIIEFSDFECPFCRKFASILDEVLPSSKGHVRVVFHHLPLSIHPWAREAAVGAACAQLQDSTAFWALQGELFKLQADITRDNVKMKIAQLARTIPTLDLATFQKCVDNDMSLGLVFRDIELASINGINATPTVFINGHRLQGIKDANQLHELIAEAMKENSSGTPPSSPSK